MIIKTKVGKYIDKIKNTKKEVLEMVEKEVDKLLIFMLSMNHGIIRKCLKL